MAHAASRVPAIIGSRHADVVWLLRSFIPGFEPSARLIRRPLVLDVDDAIWLEGLGGRSVEWLARRADAVIAGNQYLADWFSTYCRRIFVVPTAVDSRRYIRRPPGRNRPLTLGWTGTSGNFKYLAAIQPALARVLREVRGARLLVIADRKPDLPGLAGLAVEFVPWSPEREGADLDRMDIGLMPLDDDEWTRGKCSFKMLQYMAAGMATVVSPVGMNRDVLSLGASGLAASTVDEWTSALLDLAHDQDQRERLGATGRAVVEATFDVPVVARQLAKALRTTA